MNKIFPVINRGSPLSIGLVAAIPLFDRGGSTPYDFIRKIFLTTAGSPTWQTGVYGADMRFVRASSQYIASNYKLVLAANDSITISMLVKISSAAATGQIVLFGAFDASGNFPEFMCGVGHGVNNGAVAMFISGTSSGNSYAQASTTDLRDNNWHHLTYVRDGTALKILIYVDGVLIDSIADTTTGGITINSACFIAAENQNGTPAQFIDMDCLGILIHNRVLSAREVKQLYSDPFQVYEKPRYRLANIISVVGNEVFGQVSQPMVHNNAAWRSV